VAVGHDSCGAFRSSRPGALCVPPGTTAGSWVSVAGWQRIGARLERTVTLLLLPAHAAKGRSELAALGVPLPGRVVPA
jgi:hypothetical protein